MVATSSAASLHILCPTLSSLSPSAKPQFTVSPFSESHPFYHKFDRCNFSTVTSRQNVCIHRRYASSNVNFPTFSVMASANREHMVPPYSVLLTGSSKGIGYALAKEFLKAGDNVIICSRSRYAEVFGLVWPLHFVNRLAKQSEILGDRVESAVQSLREEFGEQRVWGTSCDVREGDDVKNLVAFAQEKLKYIDIWINNAGSNAYSYKPLAEASDEDLIEVVTTNLLGLMICCREGDKNTTYIHMAVSIHRSRRRIGPLLTAQGDWVSDITEINHMATQYFHNLFHESNRVADLRDQLAKFALPSLSADQQAVLRPFSEEVLPLNSHSV